MGGLTLGNPARGVCHSTLAHGVSAYPLARRYGAAVALAGAEQKPTDVLPVRIRFALHE